METEGSSPSSSPPLPLSSPPPLDPDLSSQSLEDQGPQGPTAESAPFLLSDHLRDQIVRQVEYYFSDENLPTDKFLLKFVKRDKQGFVPIAVITSFRRMQKLVQDLSLVEAALRTSSNLVVSLDGKKVKRLHPLPAAAVDAADSRTVVVENLSEDYSAECIRRTFGNIGNITNISIHDPHSKEGINRKQAKTISSKLHALIEFETVKAAENAVATLNDEKNWRGMRVRHLLKRMEKQRLIPRKDKETFPGKDDIQVSDTAVDGQKLKSVDHHDEMVEQEEEEHVPSEKGGWSRRYRSRGRGHQQQNANGHGHGRVPAGSSSDGVSKPVLGPKMPDGTRGFTVGRGKPTLLDQNHCA